MCALRVHPAPAVTPPPPATRAQRTRLVVCRTPTAAGAGPTRRGPPTPSGRPLGNLQLPRRTPPMAGHPTGLTRLWRRSRSGEKPPVAQKAVHLPAVAKASRTGRNPSVSGTEETPAPTSCSRRKRCSLRQPPRPRTDPPPPHTALKREQTERPLRPPPATKAPRTQKKGGRPKNDPHKTHTPKTGKAPTRRQGLSTRRKPWRQPTLPPHHRAVPSAQGDLTTGFGK